MDLTETRQRIERLERERDEARADADQQIAGMREVALFRAANAQGCLGSYARPLLDEVDRLTPVLEAAAAILRPARGDAPWLHTAEFDDLRAAVAAAGWVEA